MCFIGFTRRNERNSKEDNMTKPTLDDLQAAHDVGVDDAYGECIDYSKYKGEERQAYREGVKAFMGTQI